MATLKTRWLLSIWVLSLSACSSASGPPVPPSRPECYIPCAKVCQIDIHCTWDPWLDPENPAKYTLHWKPLDSEVQHLASLNGVIPRSHYPPYEDLLVWVQAESQHGTEKSPEVIINTGEIYKPLPPNITTSQDPLEINWNFTVAQDNSFGSCDVRYRIEEDQEWIQESGLQGTYSVDHPKPGMVYQFQVRCAFNKSLMSDWSEIKRITIKETAPVGVLDVWMDCGIEPESSNCKLTWKNLTRSQACGVILGYQVSQRIKNSQKVVNISTAETKGQEVQYPLNPLLKDVSSVSVSAFNSLGFSVPSNLSVPVSGKEKNEKPYLKMTEENLTVSWKHPHPRPLNLVNYVVQYKEAGRPLGEGFDWVKVSTENTTAFFTGQFKKYTPYRVSLLSVSDNNQVHRLSSAVGYSLEGTPSKVVDFKVTSIADTHVTLTWKPVPLLKQHGTILCYQIGIHDMKVHTPDVKEFNVSASKTSELLHLSPGQEYKVWIKAVTAAGPGENSTITFKTAEYLTPMLLWIILPFVVCVCVCVCITLLCVSMSGKKIQLMLPKFLFEKVPDPRNSHIFRQVKIQMNDPLAWICVPVTEPHPEISQLEVVEVPSGSFKSTLKKTSNPEGSTRPLVSAGRSQTDCKDDGNEEVVKEESQRKYGREAYSKIVDSDEEQEEKKEEKKEEEEEDKEEDSQSSSADEPFESGYEKHFMPTALEVLEVA